MMFYDGGFFFFFFFFLRCWAMLICNANFFVFLE
jgi:hypothetical protein